jgi:membrane-bound ClpP family serine protease
MSWLKVAFGIIREAAGTELGQEVIGNIRSSGKNRNSEPSPATTDIEALLAEHRAQVDRNLEAVVAMVNQQNSRLDANLRRQRVWNFALAAGLVIALILAIAAIR